MVHEDLPVNIDSQYADDALHPDVKLHQIHTDELHFFHNKFKLTDVATWPDGGIPFYNLATGKFEIIDPGISGSPGPPGADGSSVNPLGNWSNATTYHRLDLVRSGDTTYIALATSTNSQPPSANWQVVAVDGADGSNGQQGVQGLQGLPGNTGAPGPAAESLEIITASGSSQTVDLATDSFYMITLNANCSINLSDSLGRAVSAVTIEFHQGSGAPRTVSWVDSIIWFTSDGLAPVLGTSLGDINVVSLYQVNGQWRGFAPEVLGTAPADVYPVLDLEQMTAWVDQLNRVVDYVSVNSYQIGNKRVGHVWVVETRDNVDPGLSALSGGGVGTWVQGATIIWGTGTTHRRLTHFVGYDAVSGPAAPLTLHTAGEDRTGVNAIVARTTASPPAAATLAISKDISALGTTVNIAATLAAAADSDNRGVYCLARNTTTSVYTPEATWTEEPGSPQDMGSPTIRMHLIWRDDAFDTSITGTTTAANQWALAATEMEQGPTS